MSKTAGHLPPAGIELDRHAAAPLFGQLYQALRRSILQGQLRPGTRLPSTRLLAAEFGVSRNTALSAYQQLLAEGYVEARVGSGPCGARSLPDEALPVSAPAPSAPRRLARARAFSLRGEVLSSLPVRRLSPPGGGAPQPFASGLPDPTAFPFRTWARLLARRWRHPDADLLGYGDPAGYRRLREEIAGYLGAARAVRCHAEQVLVVSGSQQALDLAARLLIDPGDLALIE